MSLRSLSRLPLAAIIATCLASACTRQGMVPVAALQPDDRVTVQSAVAFPFRAEDGRSCSANRIVGRVSRVRGDTLHLRDVTELQPAAGEAAPCARPAAGWVIVPPRPQFLASRANRTATAALLVAGAVLGFTVWVVASFLSAP